MLMAMSTGSGVLCVFVMVAAYVVGVIFCVVFVILSVERPGKSCAVKSLGFFGDGGLCCVINGVCLGASGGGVSLGYNGQRI